MIVHVPWQVQLLSSFTQQEAQLSSRDHVSAYIALEVTRHDKKIRSKAHEFLLDLMFNNNYGYILHRF